MRSADNMFQKTIHGREVEHVVFKNAICEALEAMPNGGTSADLIVVLGPEWNGKDHKRILAKTLVNMVDTHLLMRVERGVFTVTPSYRRRGVSASDIYEKGILESIRARGGFARATEILADYGVVTKGREFRRAVARRQRITNDTATEADFDIQADTDSRMSGEYGAITRALAKSSKVRQDLMVPGWYNLPPEELNALPLRGYFAGLMIRTRQVDCTGSNKGWMDERDEFFTHVGAAFYAARRARGFGSPLALLRDDRIHRAVLALSERPRVKRETSNWFAAETQAKVDEMVERGADAKAVADFRADRAESREGMGVLVEVLERFEAGGEGLYGVNCHCEAPLSFYTTFAEVLEMDAAALSRGLRFVTMTGDKMRPRWGLGIVNTHTL